MLQADKHDCQRCKSLGYYTKANIVYHINYVDLHPELALENYYKDADGNIKRNLISVCHNCHEVLHCYRAKEKGVVLTEERC